MDRDERYVVKLELLKVLMRGVTVETTGRCSIRPPHEQRLPRLRKR